VRATKTPAHTLALKRVRYQENAESRRAKGREWYNQNKERSKRNCIALLREKKLWIVQQMGGKCQDCGYEFAGRPEVAELDHRSGRNIPRNTSVTSLSWKKITIELNGCDLVCANCHHIRTLSRKKEHTP
jgi:hypothetical protein